MLLAVVEETADTINSINNSEGYFIFGRGINSNGALAMDNNQQKVVYGNAFSSNAYEYRKGNVIFFILQAERGSIVV